MPARSLISGLLAGVLQEQMAQLWTLLRAEPCAVEQFLLSVLQPGVGTVDVSDHQLTAAGQDRPRQCIHPYMRVPHINYMSPLFGLPWIANELTASSRRKIE